MSPTDESWLNVSEEQLDQLLEERAGFTHEVRVLKLHLFDILFAEKRK